MKILGILPYKGLMKTVAEVLGQEPAISADLFVGDMYEDVYKRQVFICSRALFSA